MLNLTDKHVNLASRLNAKVTYAQLISHALDLALTCAQAPGILRLRRDTLKNDLKNTLYRYAQCVHEFIDDLIDALVEIGFLREFNRVRNQIVYAVECAVAHTIYMYTYKDALKLLDAEKGEITEKWQACLYLRDHFREFNALKRFKLRNAIFEIVCRTYSYCDVSKTRFNVILREV